MRIGGFIDVSTKDIPGKVCMTIFTVGCNLNCGFCHNKYLLREDVGTDVSLTDILKRVESNILVDSVNISGGEPTLQPDIVEVCSEIKRSGKYLGIDTNGSMPSVVKDLIGHVSRVSLDIKAPLKRKKYNQITRTKVDLNAILKSFDIINNDRSIDFEVRTTYIKNLLSTQDIHNLLIFLEEQNFRGTFVLQQYQYSDGVGEKYREIYYIPEHENIMNILRSNPLKQPSFKIYVRDNVVGYKAFS